MPGTLILRPLEAEFKNVPGPENEKHEIYCKFKMGAQQIRSEGCSDNALHPHWTDTLALKRDHETSLTVEMKDKAPDGSNTRLGQFEVDLNEIHPHEKTFKWYDLSGKGGVEGRLRLEIAYKGDPIHAESFDYHDKSTAIGVVTGK